MIYLIAAMSCAVIAIIAFWGCARYTQWDLNRLAALEKWSDGYFDSVTTLASNKKTPTPILEDILALNRSLDDRRTSRKLLTILKAIPTSKIKADPHRAEILEFLRNEKLAEIYREMGKSYIFTVSFKDMVRGPWIRKLATSAKEQDLAMPKSSNLDHVPTKLRDFLDKDLLQLFDFERVLINQMFPFNQDAL